MLRFISSLFKPGETPGDGPDSALLDAALQRAIDGTDSRLRLLSNHRKRLLPAVTRSVEHVLAMVDALPAATDLSRSAYSTDPRLRAFFASADRMADVVAGSASAQRFLDTARGRATNPLFGLLTIERQERKVLGMGIVGDRVQREVAQVAVNFSNHRFVGVAADETDSRWELKKRAYDFLLAQALADLATQQGRRSDLHRQQQLLRHKLDDLRAGDWGLENAFGDTNAAPGDISALERDLAAVERDLHALGASDELLERNLDRVVEILGHPDAWLDSRPLQLRLSHMGIKVAGDPGEPWNELALTEIFSGSRESRIVLPGAFPTDELPERRDLVKEALRYLG